MIKICVVHYTPLLKKYKRKLTKSILIQEAKQLLKEAAF
jgi:hypothetical protein